MPVALSRAACRLSFLYCAAARAALASLSPVHCLPNPRCGVMVNARPLPAPPFTGQVPFSPPSPDESCPVVRCALGRSMVSVCGVLLRELYQIACVVSSSQRTHFMALPLLGTRQMTQGSPMPRAMSYALLMSVAQSHPCSSKFAHVAGWTAQEAVSMWSV